MVPQCWIKLASKADIRKTPCKTRNKPSWPRSHRARSHRTAMPAGAPPPPDTTRATSAAMRTTGVSRPPARSSTVTSAPGGKSTRWAKNAPPGPTCVQITSRRSAPYVKTQRNSTGCRGWRRRSCIVSGAWVGCWLRPAPTVFPDLTGRTHLTLGGQCRLPANLAQNMRGWERLDGRSAPV